jgi:hypothetical protein
VNKLKRTLPLALLIAGAGLMRASVIETISISLSPLHAGSTLSGTFTLPDTITFGDTAPVLLSFSDPADYVPTSLMATITIGNGTPSGYSVDFSTLTFTNLSGVTTPVDTKDVDLMGFDLATCASFPCTATGGVEDRSPSVFTSSYTIAPAAVPEPNDALLLLLVLAVGFAFWRKSARVA